jgi:uroporphyrinogen decarboxylase
MELVSHSAGGSYWGILRSPLAEATVDDLDRYPWPDVGDPGFYAGLREDAQVLSENSDYAIEANGGFYSFWELGFALSGFEKLLLDLVLDEEFAIALMEKLLEIKLKGTKLFLNAIGKFINVYRVGDDPATQNGMLMPPKTYRKILVSVQVV